MKRLLYIALAFTIINGCGKNPITIEPVDEEKQKTEVIYLDETESVIEFLNSAQTGLTTSEMMSSPGLVVLSYSQFIDESGNSYDTTFAYAVFRDLNSPPINIGHWQERRGTDIGDVYLENLKLEKSTRKMRMSPRSHGQMDTIYGFEYKLKTKNFEFKHSSNHKFKIIDRSGNEKTFTLKTPDKKEIISFPEYDGRNLAIKLKTKTDSLNLIINIPITTEDGETFKPIMMLRIKVLSSSNVKIDSTVINLIPAEYRQSYLVFSIVEQQKGILDVPGYSGKVLGFVSSTIYFKVKLR